MLETILLFIKGLPQWLGAITEVLVIAVLFLTAITFLAGIWCGLKIIGTRANQIVEIQVIPPRITFRKPTKEEA